MANGISVSDGITTLDLYVVSFTEQEPKEIGGVSESFSGALRSSVRDAKRRFSVQLTPIGKTDYASLVALTANAAALTLDGPVLLNTAVTAIVRPSFQLVGVGAVVDGVNFIYSVTLSCEEVDGTVAPTVETNGYAFPGVSNHRLTLGNITELNGITKLSVVVFMTVTEAARQQMLFGRYSSSVGGTSRQFGFGFTSDRKLLAQISAGGANLSTPTSTATRLTAGKTYKLAIVYDGAQGVANDRVKMYYAARDDSTLAYPAVTTDSVDYFGTALAATLQTVATLTAYLGGEANTTEYFGGYLHDVRAIIGTALTSTQINAETLAANPVAASLRYKLDAPNTTSEEGLENSGSVSGYTATASSTAPQLVVPIYFVN